MKHQDDREAAVSVSVASGLYQCYTATLKRSGLLGGPERCMPHAIF